MNQLSDPSQRDAAIQAHTHIETLDARRARSRTCRRGHNRRPLVANSHRYPDSIGRVPRSQNPLCSESERNLELHKSVHDLRAPSRLPRTFREGSRRTRSARPRTFQQHGSSPPRSGDLHENFRRMAILRAERNGNSIALFAPASRFSDSHFSLRPPAPARRSMPERLRSSARCDPLIAITSHSSSSPPAPAFAIALKKRNRKAAIWIPTACKLSRSKLPKPAPNGCTAAFARTGVSRSAHNHDG